MLLESPIAGTDKIPVIADDETARYILKLGIGETISIPDQNGQPHALQLVATLAGSIFQGELLMSEANFRRLFPSSSGWGVVLVESDAANANEVARIMGEELDAFAVTVDRTTDRLARYKQVANTYLSTFQTLGSLGLLLGTLGQAVVLLRALIERRSELAFLSALGFSRLRRLKLIVVENMAVLMVGMLAGATCALVAVMPAVTSSGRSIHLLGLGAALAAILLTGLIVLALTAWTGGRTISSSDLRAE
jgi:ABC-type lipoprotein release transport system permease subunit